MKKEHEYAMKIKSQLLDIFDPESENFIDPKEFEEDPDNAAAFLHAMATMAPNIIFHRLTGQQKNNLEFNHIANQLVFQYSEVVSA